MQRTSRGGITSLHLIAAATTLALAWLVTQGPAVAQNAYITNASSNNVSVINTTTNTVVATIPVDSGKPFGIAVTPDGSKVYVTNQYGQTVSVINTATNTVFATITFGNGEPFGIAVPVGSGPGSVWKFYSAETIRRDARFTKLYQRQHLGAHPQVRKRCKSG